MIYTLTTNPAIDYYLHLDTLSVGSIHRSSNETISLGGKGINVSIILKELGAESVATGFLAGFTGAALRDGLSDMGIGNDFVMLTCGYTRINVKVRSGQETDINAVGPIITSKDTDELLCKFDKLKSGDYVVLAGNVQSCLPTDFYSQIMEALSEKNIRFIIDAEKDTLTSCLKHNPFLIKPNEQEIFDIFGTRITCHEDALDFAYRLQQMGAQNVLISLGEKGAVLLDQHNIGHTMSAFKGIVKNTVGAGDSVVGGFLAGYLESKNYEYALKLGCAAGSATAFSEHLANKALIEGLLKQSGDLYERQ